MKIFKVIYQSYRKEIRAENKQEAYNKFLRLYGGLILPLKSNPIVTEVKNTSV